MKPWLALKNKILLYFSLFNNKLLPLLFAGILKRFINKLFKQFHLHVRFNFFSILVIIIYQLDGGHTKNCCYMKEHGHFHLQPAACKQDKHIVVVTYTCIKAIQRVSEFRSVVSESFNRRNILCNDNGFGLSTLASL